MCVFKSHPSFLELKVLQHFNVKHYRNVNALQMFHSVIRYVTFCFFLKALC